MPKSSTKPMAIHVSRTQKKEDSQANSENNTFKPLDHTKTHARHAERLGDKQAGRMEETNKNNKLTIH